MSHPVLSFDDGPHPEFTPEILDLLYASDVQATFFVVGESIVRNDWIVSRMAEEGHTVGVHGLTHRRLTELDDHDVRAELGVTAELIHLITGTWPPVWRAPYFDADPRCLAIGESLGLRHVGADIVPDDWMAVDGEALAAVVLAEVFPGSVVCLHDGVPPRGGSTHCTDSRQPTVDALRLILAEIGGGGGRLGGFGEIVETPGKQGFSRHPSKSPGRPHDAGSTS